MKLRIWIAFFIFSISACQIQHLKQKDAFGGVFLPNGIVTNSANSKEPGQHPEPEVANRDSFIASNLEKRNCESQLIYALKLDTPFVDSGYFTETEQFNQIIKKGDVANALGQLGVGALTMGLILFLVEIAFNNLQIFGLVSNANYIIAALLFLLVIALTLFTRFKTKKIYNSAVQIPVSLLNELRVSKDPSGYELVTKMLLKLFFRFKPYNQQFKELFLLFQIHKAEFNKKQIRKINAVILFQKIIYFGYFPFY